MSPAVYLLNFKFRIAGVLTSCRPRSFTSIAIVDRALGGSNARKFRAVFPERALNGENAVETAVMYFVNIIFECVTFQRSAKMARADAPDREETCTYFGQVGHRSAATSGKQAENLLAEIKQPRALHEVSSPGSLLISGHKPQSTRSRKVLSY